MAPNIWNDARIARLGAGLAAAANNARIGLSVVRRDLPQPIVVYISEAGADIMGYSRAEIVNRPATAFLSNEDRAKYTTSPEALAARKPDHQVTQQAFETTVVTKSGAKIPCEVTMSPVEFEGESLLIVFFQDISARHLSTHSLRQSEARFRALIERAPDAVWINDGRRLLYVNSASVRMLGYDSIDELLGRSALDIVHPDDHPVLRDRMTAVISSREPLPPREYRAVRKDGSVLVTEVQSMAVDWEDRKAILGFARDVTARKEMEAKLAQSQRLAALGTLLAGIAHEMNNPLAYVLLGIERALAELEASGGYDPSPDRTRALIDLLHNIQHGADRVAGIVRQVRATAAPESGGQVSLDLRDVLNAALRVAGNELRHRAEVATSFADVPPVQGDPQRLEQVFLNLLVNAAHALPEGRAANRIDVRLFVRRKTRSTVVVEIEDNGSGVAPEILPRIFDPFFTTKPVGVGTGLGLSICHGIVNAHGGTIEVESTPDVRTIFRVYLPVCDAATPTEIRAEPPSSPVVATPVRKRRILIVDDEPTLSAMIRRLLETSFDTEIASTGKQALEQIKNAEPGYDVVLCDLMMPGMTGMDLYAAVATSRPGSERKFVFMTGGAFTERASEFLASIRNRSIEKPFDIATLRAAIDDH